MTTPVGQEISISYGAYPYGYVNGLQISNDPTTPNTLLNVGAGVTIDSTDTFQMINNATIVINAATVGLNGIDTGVLAASTVYAVYLVSDPVTLRPIGAMLSLNYVTPTTSLHPYMPFGYSAFKLIGFAATDASAHFLLGFWTAGNSSWRQFVYSANQVTAVTAGTSSTLAPVNLISLVPNLNNLPVQILAAFTPAAASDVLVLQSGLSNSAGTQAMVVGQVASVEMTPSVTVMAQPVVISTVSSPAINYKVSGGTVAIDVYGYNWTV